MFKRNLHQFFRNFSRDKTSFLINLVGLSTGLACTFLIYLWVNVQPWYFLGAGLIALLIAWLTVGMHAIRAANINPAQCLKDE